jgi:hypothetical protein
MRAWGLPCCLSKITSFSTSHLQPLILSLPSRLHIFFLAWLFGRPHLASIPIFQTASKSFRFLPCYLPLLLLTLNRFKMSSPSPPPLNIPSTPPPVVAPSSRRAAFTPDIPIAELTTSSHPSSTIQPRSSVGFDNVHHRGFKIAKGVRIRPMHILSICWRTASPASKCVNLLWPLVPTAITLQYTHPNDLHLLVFIMSYLAMVPCANLIGFASHECTRKLPKVLGHLVEIVLASTPETILLLVLLHKKQYVVIQAAVLGSILATLLLCLGVCFFCGGLIYSEQTFNRAVSELGSDLLLTAYVLPPLSRLCCALV